MFEDELLAAALADRRRNNDCGGVLGRDVAPAILLVEQAVPGTELEVPVLSELHLTRVIAESPCDPEAPRDLM